MANKYQAKGWYLNHLDGSATRLKPSTKSEGFTYIDSTLELQVYRILRQYFGEINIKIHPTIPVKPATDTFPAINWEVDFKVNLPLERQPLYIEAKGLINSDFHFNIPFLEYCYPETFKRLIVVDNKRNNRPRTFWGFQKEWFFTGKEFRKYCERRSLRPFGKD